MKMPQNSWNHCNSFTHFQKVSEASCRVHWLSLLNAELCKNWCSHPMSSQQHRVYKQHCWTAEATGLFSVQEQLFRDSFNQVMKVGETNVLNIYKGPLNFRSEEKALIRHSPTDAGSALPERAASCTVPSMCRMETNILEKFSNF